MASPFLKICITGVTLSLMTASTAMSIEPLTNGDMDRITGQATIQPSDEKLETAYTVETEITPREDILKMVLPKPEMSPSTLDSDYTHAVLIDFLGTDAREDLGIEAEDFHGEAEVGNVVYTDEDTLTSVILDGTFTGYFTVPTTFSDDLKEHDIRVSASRIPPKVIEDYNKGDSHFILSYQGVTYTPDQISGSDKSFKAKPNRQAQLTGRAEGKRLNILVPSGHGDNTSWHIITTVDPGEAFVQIDINRLINHHKMKYTVKIANNEAGLNAGDPGSRPTDRSGTLGTLYMGGNGSTTVEPGSIVITTFDDGV